MEGKRIFSWLRWDLIMFKVLNIKIFPKTTWSTNPQNHQTNIKKQALPLTPPNKLHVFAYPHPQFWELLIFFRDQRNTKIYSRDIEPSAWNSPKGR